MVKVKSEFVTPKEAAEILKCGLSTVYLAIQRGDLLPVHPFASLLRRHDLESFTLRSPGPKKKERQTA